MVARSATKPKIPHLFLLNPPVWPYTVKLIVGEFEISANCSTTQVRMGNKWEWEVSDSYWFLFIYRTLKYPISYLHRFICKFYWGSSFITYLWFFSWLVPWFFVVFAHFSLRHFRIDHTNVHNDHIWIRHYSCFCHVHSFKRSYKIKGGFTDVFLITEPEAGNTFSQKCLYWGLREETNYFIST